MIFEVDQVRLPPTASEEAGFSDGHGVRPRLARLLDHLFPQGRLRKAVQRVETGRGRAHLMGMGVCAPSDGVDRLRGDEGHAVARLGGLDVGGEEAHPTITPDLTSPTGCWRNPLDEDDSPATVLRSLEKDRGTLYSEKEYQEIRQLIIEELARGPARRISTIVTFATVGGLLLAVTALGLAIALSGMVSDYILAITGLCALGVWGYLFRGYLRAFRLHALRSVGERLAELEELRALQLVSQREFERVSAAIQMGRQIPVSRARV